MRSMRFVLRYLEIIFTMAGLAVIFGVTALVHPSGTSPWAVAAVTATLVGVIHGLLFWFIRHRQREARRSALEETQRMRRDVVMNQVAIIRLSLERQGTTPQQPHKALLRVEEAVGVINATLSDLSEESLTRWRSRYAVDPSRG